MSEAVRAACERLWRAGKSLTAISRCVGLPEQEVWLAVQGVTTDFN